MKTKRSVSVELTREDMIVVQHAFAVGMRHYSSCKDVLLPETTKASIQIKFRDMFEKFLQLEYAAGWKEPIQLEEKEKQQ